MWYLSSDSFYRSSAGQMKRLRSAPLAPQYCRAILGNHALLKCCVDLAYRQLNGSMRYLNANTPAASALASDNNVVMIISAISRHNVADLFWCRKVISYGLRCSVKAMPHKIDCTVHRAYWCASQSLQLSSNPAYPSEQLDQTAASGVWP